MTPEQKQQVEAYLMGCSSRKFERGVWDCAIFCADILAILTGNDFAAPYRGGYEDREGALRVLPCKLEEMPEWVGLKPCEPKNGAVWWGPSAHAEGALGIIWQGRAYQPGRRGIKCVINDLSKLKIYS